MLLKNVGSVLLDIYQVYFQHEVRGSEGEEKVTKMNEKAIFEFFRDYDLCPDLITKGVAYKLYLQSYESPMAVYTTCGLDIVEAAGGINNPKIAGRYFTFLMFLDVLAKCSKCSY